MTTKLLQSNSIAGIQKIVESLATEYNRDRDVFIISDGSSDWDISTLLSETENENEINKEWDYPVYGIRINEDNQPIDENDNIITKKLTADEIKQQAIDAGVPEWWFDELSDETIERECQDIDAIVQNYNDEMRSRKNSEA